MAISIEKPLPGELEGKVDPEDYGFGVIKDEPQSEDEIAQRVGRFYARLKDRTGLVIPALEPFLGESTDARDAVGPSD